MSSVRVQRRYDHRVRLKVFQGECGIELSQPEPIPRSTLATWKSRPPKEVVTLACDQPGELQFDRTFLIAENRRLKSRIAALQPIVMLLCSKTAAQSVAQ